MNPADDTGAASPVTVAKACSPVVERDGLYMLSDVRKSLGISSSQLARWKRDPHFVCIQLPGGDAVYGADLIDWLRQNRVKQHHPAGGMVN